MEAEGGLDGLGELELKVVVAGGNHDGGSEDGMLV